MLIPYRNRQSPELRDMYPKTGFVTPVENRRTGMIFSKIFREIKIIILCFHGEGNFDCHEPTSHLT